MEVLDTSIANVALPYMAGRPRRQQRREHLGAHLLSGLECHRAAHQRLARRRSLAASASSWLCLCHLHREFAALRHRSEPAVLLLLFRVLQGAGGGGLAAHGAGHSGGHVSAAETRPGLRALWHHRRHGALPSARRWADGLPTTTPGAGSSSSICRSACWR